MGVGDELVGLFLGRWRLPSLYMYSVGVNVVSVIREFGHSYLLANRLIESFHGRHTGLSLYSLDERVNVKSLVECVLRSHASFN